MFDDSLFIIGVLMWIIGLVTTISMGIGVWTIVFVGGAALVGRWAWRKV